MNALTDWIDDRTGLPTAIRDDLGRKIPGSAGWRNVWPATILFAFGVQAVTGLFLWIYYSPGANSAWESVYFLQHKVAGGWLLRGIHHYAAQVLIALLMIYVIQMIVRGAYRRPREFVFWTAVVLGLTAMGSVITGDLLSWDQNSYHATKVRVSFLTLVPVVGGDLFKLAAGGPAFGHLTLTRFFALHAGVFSTAFFVFLVLHGRATRRAEATETTAAPRAAWYWPNQALYDAAACVLVMTMILLLSVQHVLHDDNSGLTDPEIYGARLGAPADPAEAYPAARPEWSLLGVYELSNLFPGDAMPGLPVSWKIVPIFVIPGVVVLLVLAMPFVGTGRRGHHFNLALTGVILVGVIALSVRVVIHDRGNPEHQAALAAATDQAHRIVVLADAPQGIPAQGALALVRDDPKIQGPVLFKRHCAGCHDYLAEDDTPGIPSETPSAPNLHGFAGEAWIAGLLDRDQVDGPAYFGNTAFEDGTMVDFVNGNLRDLRDDIPEEEFDSLVAALAAESAYDTPRPDDAVDEDTKFLFEDFTCVDCHKFYDLGDLGSGPDLTGYGSREWLLGIISDASHERFYGSENDRMPLYAEDPESPENNILPARQLEMLVDWLRGDWYEPEPPAE